MRLIYLSGIDGCGKTTQAKLLVEELNRQGYSTTYSWLRWEPSVVGLIKFLRRFKTRKWSDTHEKNSKIATENFQEGEWLKFKRRLLSSWFFRRLWLFYACGDYYLAYLERFKVIRSDILVLDRYFYDFMIDQAINLGLSPEKCQELRKDFFLSRFYKPDISIIIDLPPEEGYRRKNDGTSISYLTTRECYYANLFPHNEALHLDGLNSVSELSAQIKQYILNNLE